jgi:hypothetical protein
LLEDLASESGNAQLGPLGDFDNDGVKNIFDYDSDSDGIYDGFELYDYQDPSLSWYPLGTDMFDPDQNSDGVIDGFSTDFDQDGLSDNTELTAFIPGYTYTSLGDENTTYGRYGHILNHTLCALADTDGDGFDDGWETNFGSDPLNPDNFPQIFRFDVEDLGFNLRVSSSSNIQNFQFDSENRQVEFDVSGPDGTRGFCNISLPRGLLYAPEGEWEVLIDDAPVEYSAISNATATWIYFSYFHSEHHITIRGTEALQPVGGIDPLLIGAIAGIAGLIVVIIIFVMKKKRT